MTKMSPNTDPKLIQHLGEWLKRRRFEIGWTDLGCHLNTLREKAINHGKFETYPSLSNIFQMESSLLDLRRANI